jgi:hypothetical protein
VGDKLSSRIKRDPLARIQLPSAFYGFSQGFRIIAEFRFLKRMNPTQKIQAFPFGKSRNRILYFFYCLHVESLAVWLNRFKPAYFT